MEQAHLEILLEDIRAKFDLVLEGHAALLAEIRENRRESNEKHDLTAFKLMVLNDKIDAIAVDLAAHRADTEAHPRYLVRE
jgi:hypothetical protein